MLPVRPRRPTAEQALLAAVLALGALPRVFLALTDDGLYWPDEIHQTLEPAHRLVFGYGLVAHEFVRGMRSWVLPGLIAVPLELWKLAGGTDPRAYLALVHLSFVAVAVATAYGVHRLARACGANPLAATAAAGLFSLAAPCIYFGHRPLSETASALPVVLGFALALDPSSTRRSRLAGASLLGFSVLLRLQNGIFCAALVLFLLARRKPRDALLSLAVLSAWALAFGLFDLFTWGSLFHSATAYLRFNALEGRSALWGVSPPSYYAAVLWRCMPLPLLCIAIFAPLAAGRAAGAGLLCIALGFAVLHSLVPHKELRFFLPGLPLFCALAGVGMDVVARNRLLRIAPPVLVLACGVFSAAAFHTLRFGQLGQYEQVKPRAWAYDDFGQVNRLLLAAHDLPDLCGLKLEGVDLVWSGGYSYLHRPVPLYPHDTGPGRAAGTFNYALAVRGRASGPGTVVARQGPYDLLRVRDGCVPDPAFSPLLR
jgi:GPI mannosyltransferase 3